MPHAACPQNCDQHRRLRGCAFRDLARSGWKRSPVDSGDGLVFPDLNVNPATATDLVMPKPCKFISEDLPLCSISRPTSPSLAGATAAVNFLTKTGLFVGQSDKFFRTLSELAKEADRAARGF